MIVQDFPNDGVQELIIPQLQQDLGRETQRTNSDDEQGCEKGKTGATASSLQETEISTHLNNEISRSGTRIVIGACSCTCHIVPIVDDTCREGKSRESEGSCTQAFKASQNLHGPHT